MLGWTKFAHALPMKRALISLCLLLGACASPPPLTPEASPAPKDPVAAKLQDQYRQWRGVKYRLGGTTKNGVDCSAFTQITFRDQFATALSRTTAAQVKEGRWVGQGELLAGDLVFFKIGRTRHVGIYQGQGLFLHASTSQGVMLSSLKDPYWQAHYWTARRIL